MITGDITLTSTTDSSTVTIRPTDVETLITNELFTVTMPVPPAQFETTDPITKWLNLKRIKRVYTVTGKLTGTSTANLLANKNTLIKIIGAGTGSGEQQGKDFTMSWGSGGDAESFTVQCLKAQIKENKDSIENLWYEVILQFIVGESFIG